MRAPSKPLPVPAGGPFEAGGFESEEILMIRLLRLIHSASHLPCARLARRGALTLAVIATALLAACETPEMAPPPPPEEEIFESPEPSAPIQEESLGPPPVPLPPVPPAPGVPSPAGATTYTPPGATTYPPAVVPIAPTPERTLPPAGDEEPSGGRPRLPMSSPGAAPSGAAPSQPSSSE